MFACLRCFRSYAAWVMVLLWGHCPECGAGLVEVEASEIVPGEF